MSERWLPVVGHEGSYEVSDKGRVRSVDRYVVVLRFGNSGSRRCVGRILTLSLNKQGYLQVQLSRGHRKLENVPVHKLVLQSFSGLRPPGLGARHLNGNPLDASLGNLEWGTQSDNIYDQVRHGTNRESRKTHCPRGHLLQLPNLQPTALREGRRSCYACTKARGRIAYALRKQGVALDFKGVSDNCYAEIMSLDANGNPV